VARGREQVMYRDRKASRPTMRQLADAAGVSMMTATYVYSRPGRVAPATGAKARAAGPLSGTGGLAVMLFALAALAGLRHRTVAQ
jgi:Bacterial regulatory proteins, lacI family